MFIAFRLKPGRDNDLIGWINNAREGDRSYHIREALRQSLFRQATPLPDIKIKPKEAKEATLVKADLEKNLEEWL